MIFGSAVNKYYKQNWYWFLIGIIVIAAIDYVQVLIPSLISDIIAGLTDQRLVMDDIVAILFEIGMFVLIIMVGRFVWRMTIITASRRFDYGIRNDLFEHATKLSNQFYSEHKVGGLMAYFTNDVEAVRRAVGFGMIMVVDTFFLGTIVIYRMVQIDPLLTVFTAVPMLIIALVGSAMGRNMRRKFKDAQQAFEDLSDFSNESLSGIRVVKAFIKEPSEIREFLKYNQNTHDKNIDYVKIQATLQIIIGTAVRLIFAVIIGYGGWLIYSYNELGRANPFTNDQLVEFFLLFNMLIWPMMALGRIINVRNRGKGSLQRIEKILNEPVDVLDSDSIIDVDHIRGDITFKNLSFRYPDGTVDVLKNLDFSIHQGEMVGILGRTGSGKTSLVDLLLRIYNVEKGTLFIDGHDIMDLPLAKVRDSIGYVPQDGFLFSDSIKNNISLSFAKDPEESKRVTEAAMLSDVHDNIVEFNEGYNTVIGERGVTLSGGQRQRLSIARALMKHSPIMILDDSVSAVDTNTEVTIINNLKAVRKEKTTILIAHRISTLKHADKIIVIDDGEILDIGSHDVLLERSDFYRNMVERQKLEDEMEVF